MKNKLNEKPKIIPNCNVDGKIYQVAILGEIFGIGISPRTEIDPHVMIDLLWEDDGDWHKTDEASTHWLDSMINVMLKTQTYLNKNCKKIDKGWEFR